MPYNHKHRSQFHFSPERNWMNDPNGCVYHDSQYHLYYQYHPESTLWGPMHWGHAVSKDLVHWEEQEIALYPDEDTGMAFSGSGLVDEHDASGLFDGGRGLLFFYTGHLGEGENQIQQQCLACSADGGRTLKKYAANPIIPNSGKQDFRDPKVIFHQKSSRWIMVLAAGKQVDIYSSEDLKKWTEETPFAMDTGLLDGVWECPDLFPLPKPGEPGELVWIMTVSLQVQSQDPAQLYVCGDFDGHRFIPLESEKFKIADYGLDFYAAQSWSGIPGSKKTWIGWCNNWNYAADTPETNIWRGAMTLPRELSLIPEEQSYTLAQKPVETLNSLRKAQSIREESVAEALSLPLNEAGLWDLQLTQIQGLKEKDAFTMLFYWNSGSHLKLSLGNGKMILDRSRCGAIFNSGNWNCSEAPLPAAGILEDCRILLDRSIIEIFAAGGRSCMANQIFPDGELERLEIIPAKGSRIGAISGFPLKSIWGESPN